MIRKNLIYTIVLAMSAGCLLSCAEATYDEQTKTSECSGNQRYCDQTRIVQCVNGTMQTVITCSGTTPICDPATLSCIPQPECTEGAKHCNGSVLESCANKRWVTVSDCSASGMKCDSETKSCTATGCSGLTTGQSMCSSDQKSVLTCSGGTTLIPKTCNNTQCQILSPGTAVCADTSISAQCTSDVCKDGSLSRCVSGKLSNSETCNALVANSTPACNAAGNACELMCKTNFIKDSTGTNCIPAPAACTENAYSCDGLNIYQCKNGNNTQIKSCPAPNASNHIAASNCNPTNGTCAITCESGYQLDASGNCVKVQTECKDASGKTIADGARGCSTSTMLSICSQGQWVPNADNIDCSKIANANTGGTCSNSACVFTCKSGFTKSDNACIASSSGGGSEHSVLIDFVTAETVSASQAYTNDGSTTIDGVTINVVGRTLMTNNDTDYSIKDKDGVILKGGIILHKDKGHIKATNITKGLGTVTIDYNAWDSASVTLTVGSASLKSQSVLKPTAGTLTFEVNQKDASSFIITTSNRVAFNNLKWTDYK